TARIGMLDDRNGRSVELGDTLERRVGVGQIVVRQFFALHLSRGRHAEPRAVDVKSGVLMRVFAVAQSLPQRSGDGQAVREGLLTLFREPGGDGGVIGSRA